MYFLRPTFLVRLRSGPELLGLHFEPAEFDFQPAEFDFQLAEFHREPTDTLAARNVLSMLAVTFLKFHVVL